MPEAVIRNFTIAAKEKNKDKFDFLCKDENLRKILRKSRKVIFMKLEIFLKAFTILYAPNLYFYMRKGK